MLTSVIIRALVKPSLEAEKIEPGATGKWEALRDDCLGGMEARVTWSDGWKDILRLENGAFYKIALHPGNSWIDPQHGDKVRAYKK